MKKENNKPYIISALLLIILFAISFYGFQSYKRKNLTYQNIISALLVRTSYGINKSICKDAANLSKVDAAYNDAEIKISRAEEAYNLLPDSDKMFIDKKVAEGTAHIESLFNKTIDHMQEGSQKSREEIVSIFCVITNEKAEKLYELPRDLIYY